MGEDKELDLTVDKGFDEGENTFRFGLPALSVGLQKRRVLLIHAFKCVLVDILTLLQSIL